MKQLIMGEMNWSQSVCLGCDRQTDGNAYCGEGCRFADYERAISGTASSQGSDSWTRLSNNLHLHPAYNFRQKKFSTMQSTPSISSELQLSDAARCELLAYASSFDQSRQLRRQHGQVSMRASSSTSVILRGV